MKPQSTSAVKKMTLGTAKVSPTGNVRAGARVTIRFSYTAGQPIDDTGAVKISFRYAGDFGVPQFTNPAGPDYCTVATSARCRIEPRWDPKGSIRPWDRTLYLKVMAGFVNKGETIAVTFGDTSKGSVGWRMQTFCESSFEFKTSVDPFATFKFKELPRSPVLKVIPGPPVKAVCTAPSSVLAGKRFSYYLKLEDAWGNPVKKPVRRSHKGFSKPGIKTIKITDRLSKLKAVSNPILVTANDSTTLPFWGDIHGQSEETIGTNTVEDYFAFARDYALLDIGAHQGNDFQIDDALWKKINQTTRKFNCNNKFVTLPGYEWSGNTPLGGDRNVWFSNEGGPIIRSSLELVKGGTSVFPVARTARDLFRMLQDLKEPDPYVCAHVGGRYADLSTHDSGIEFAVEVHSAWGTFEWMVEDAFRRGYRVGISANSDGHKGRPGASYPGAGKFGSYGGLTCVLADRLDRPSILSALRARRFYATTGHRPIIDVSVQSKDAESIAVMGEVLETRENQLSLIVKCVGTSPLEHIEVRNGVQLIRRIFVSQEDDSSNRIKITWSGAKVRGRDRATSWDGTLRIIGNSYQTVCPVNFWNPECIPQQGSDQRLAWTSTTTGGVAGVILELKRPRAGKIEVTTPQGIADCEIASLRQQPKTWAYGGEAMQIQISRLPKRPPLSVYKINFPLTDLHKGDNPIYVRVTQEDGHMAWTSPIYLVRK